MSKNVILLAIMMSIIGTAAFFNAMFLTYETIRYPDYTMAATTSAVNVSAEIAGAISCSSATDTTTFTTWTGGDTSIKTSSPNASTTMSCPNSAGGCTLSVKDAGGGGQGGLYKNPDLIESPNGAFSATATLSSGVEGYGIQAATNTVGSGAALGIAPRYLELDSDVGGLLTSNTTIASSSATTSNREIIVTHKAAISIGTPSGSYTDTITYECIEN